MLYIAYFNALLALYWGQMQLFQSWMVFRYTNVWAVCQTQTTMLTVAFQTAFRQPWASAKSTGNTRPM